MIFISYFFQKCPTKCAELRDCVECKVHDTGKLSKKECDECAINIEVKEFIEGNVYFIIFVHSIF